MLPRLTPEILIAAIAGFEAQKSQIDSQIAELRSMLDGSRTEPAATPETARPRKKRSAAVRRKMKLAQQLRWKKIKERAEPPQSEPPKPKKRKLSAAGRRRIVKATKKRWAAFNAAKQAESPVEAKKVNRKKAAA